jgi:hypothetical protein
VLENGLIIAVTIAVLTHRISVTLMYADDIDDVSSMWDSNEVNIRTTIGEIELNKITKIIERVIFLLLASAMHAAPPTISTSVIMKVAKR